MYHYLSQFFFILVLAVAIFFFRKNVLRIRKAINLGKKLDRSDKKSERLKTMLKVAFGQTKMAARPIPFVLHFIVYAGFVLINIEVLEIIIDGIFGSHRVFMKPLGNLYIAAISFFEILAVLVLVACIFFLTRRWVAKIPRFHKPEMKGWPSKDATYILIIEIVLMFALLVMNATDNFFQNNSNMPISSYMVSWFDGLDHGQLHYVERTAWWFHIIGILLFLNYLPFSKHFHIILAFPNTYFSNLEAKGRLDNMESVTNEVKMMLDPSTAVSDAPPPESFGVKDITDLTWKNIMDAYTCTECGRCTSECPANITGKILSPRKIVMNVRDRAEELIDEKTENKDQERNLHSLISEEELWACTTCNACVDACPVNINPMEVIVGMRQYLVMEKSSAPEELNIMFNNVENNGAPWQFSPSDRSNWAEELNNNE